MPHLHCISSLLSCLIRISFATGHATGISVRLLVARTQCTTDSTARSVLVSCRALNEFIEEEVCACRFRTRAFLFFMSVLSHNMLLFSSFVCGGVFVDSRLAFVLISVVLPQFFLKCLSRTPTSQVLQWPEFQTLDAAFEDNRPSLIPNPLSSLYQEDA